MRRFCVTCLHLRRHRITRTPVVIPPAASGETPMPDHSGSRVGLWLLVTVDLACDIASSLVGGVTPLAYFEDVITSSDEPSDGLFWSTLREEAAAVVPPGDPFLVAGTSLPAMKARQARFGQRMLARGDRLGELIAAGLSSEFEGGYLVSTNRLSADQIEELRSLAPEAEATVLAELGQAFGELRSVLAGLDPLLTTAQISFNHTVGFAGTYDEPSNDRSEVSVEIVASLFASQPVRERAEQADSGTIQMIEDLLESIRWLQQLVLVLQAWNDQDERAGYLRMVGRMRLSSVRGESYASHGQEVAVAVLRPLGTRMRREFGFTIDDFLAVANAAYGLVVDRLNDHSSRMAVVFSRVAAASVGDLTETQKLELGSEVMGAFDDLPRQLVFLAADVATHGGLDVAVVASVLERTSVSAGELDSNAYRSALDPCPLWQRPFLRSGDKYVLPVAGHALRSPLDAFEQGLLSTMSTFSRRRAEAVDALALRYLADALPGSEVFGPGAYYVYDDGDGSARYETDGIVVFDGWVLVVEGKANSLSLQSHRGDLVRLGRDIADSLRDAWGQCARVQRYLTSASTVTFENERGDRSFTVEGAEPNRVLFVNPMLHTLGVFAFELPRLASLVSFKSSGVPWPVLITDLRVITELSGPAGLLHYMVWRSQLPLGDGMYAVDELDIFGSYLFGGVGGPSPGPGLLVSLASSTTTFDQYYFAVEAGKAPEPPRRVLGDWLESVLDDLATTRPYLWLDQSFIVLDLTLMQAAWLSSFAETLASRQIKAGRWFAQQFGDIVAVAVADGVEWTEVLLEVSPTISLGSRWFAVRLERDGPRFISCARNPERTDDSALASARRRPHPIPPDS